MSVEQQRIVIVGAGGFGREIFAVIDGFNRITWKLYDVVGFVDDGDVDEERLVRLGVPLLGPVETAADLDAGFVIGVGDPAMRRQLDERLMEAGAQPAAPVVHPMSYVGPDVELGPGAVLCAGVCVTTNVRAGRHLHLNMGAAVGHDVVMGDYVTVSPQCSVLGNVTLGDGVFLGAGVEVLPGRMVGAKATVGAGATVTRDLPPALHHKGPMHQKSGGCTKSGRRTVVGSE